MRYAEHIGTLKSPRPSDLNPRIKTVKPPKTHIKGETQPEKTGANEDISSALKTLSAGVAHEIRNPLAVIQSLVQTLAQKTSDPKQKELADAIEKEVARLNRFLGEFLQYGRPPALKPEASDIAGFIDQALCFALPPNGDAKITVHRDIPDDLPPIFVDPEACHQVLLNAVLNAIQAMKGAGTLEIRARSKPTQCMLEIKDSGPGIPPENLEKVFLPFFSTKRRGSGLGLAISRQIVDAHGGRIYFENNVNEKGVTLIMAFPQRPEDKGL